MTTVPDIGVYTGDVPDRSTMSKEEFSDAVGDYLDYFNDDFTPDSASMTTGMNTLSGEMNDLGDVMEVYAGYKGDYAAGITYAQGESASYTDGSIYISKVDSNTGNQPDTSPTQWYEKISEGGSSAWGDITGKPTTISGYGITDGVKSDTTGITADQVDNMVVVTQSVYDALTPDSDTVYLVVG